MKLTFSQSILFSVCGIFVLNTSLGCSAPTYTYRCACNKIAYDAEGTVLEDDSFNQVVCDTTENIEAVFEGELSELAQKLSAVEAMTNMMKIMNEKTVELMEKMNYDERRYGA